MANIVLKTVDAAVDTDNIDSGSGSFDAILSTEAVDRDGESLKLNEWVQPLPDHIPIDVDHAMTVEKTIGTGHPYIDGDAMKVHVELADTPLAQQVRSMMQQGVIDSVSVGFRYAPPIENADGTVLPQRELVNAGVVNTPANPEATLLAVKGLQLKEGRRNSKSDAANVQAIHDAAVALGATCPHDDDHDSAGPDEGGKAADVAAQEEETHTKSTPVPAEPVPADKADTDDADADAAELLRIRVRAISLAADALAADTDDEKEGAHA